jgi:hypothetical protein
MKPQKILLVTSFSKPWDNGWYYKTGFEKLGHTVAPFDPEGSGRPGEDFFALMRDFRPDLLIQTKNELPLEIFQEAGRLVRLVMWYPDPVIPEWLPPYVKACSLFLTMSEGLVGEFKKYNPNTHWLSQAFEPSHFDVGEIGAQEMEKYAAEVTFVGNLGSKPQYLPRRAYLRRVAREGFKLKWWGPRIPGKISTIPLILGRLGRAYGGEFVWGRSFALAARAAKIFLAFDSIPGVRKSMSARMYTAIGCGAFYLCANVEGIEEVFQPGKEIAVFNSEQEMVDMIKYYLKHDSERAEIAEAGRRRLLKEHTYEHRLTRMMEIIAGDSGELQY